MSTATALRQGPGTMIELRTYVFIDSLQPQLAEYMATVSQGFLPIPGDACLWVEVSPGMAVHKLTDAALEASSVRLAQQVVERAFGTMVIHHRVQSDVIQSGNTVLERLGREQTDRQPCRIAWQEIIRGMTPDHTVLINRQNRSGNMILPNASMFILEVEPAGYITYAANQAEKAANISLIEVHAVGKYGRLTIAGTEGNVDEAARAALAAVENPAYA